MKTKKTKKKNEEDEIMSEKKDLMAAMHEEKMEGMNKERPSCNLHENGLS